MTTASESAEHQIQTEISLLKFLKHTCILYHLKVILLLIPPMCPISNRFYSETTTAKAPNNYVKSPPSHRKILPFFQPKRGVTKSTKRDNESLTFDDLHQLTPIGLHVTQYMYVLFYKVHIYIQKSHFTLACYVQ